MPGQRLVPLALSCAVLSNPGSLSFVLHPGLGAISQGPHRSLARTSATSPAVTHAPSSVARVKSRSLKRPRCQAQTTSTIQEAQASGIAELLHPRNGVQQRYIFFGGKGGVGKTSTSAAVAVKCADAGLRTLVISTDPAHSLGDALDQNISGGKPVQVNGIDNLYAMEIDAQSAVQEFEEALSTFDSATLASSIGVSKDILEGLGIDEFSQMLRNLPPGIDELVALADVVRLANDKEEAFDRIVIDTAPTGHTLRLLGFPEFLDQFLDKVIKLRSRLDGMLGLLKAFSGNKGGPSIVEKADVAVERLQRWRQRMVELRELFQNRDATEFCVVTIPTQLAIAESKRLLQSLEQQGVAVRNMVVNQLISPGATDEYIGRLTKGQEVCLDRLAPLGEQGISITKVPYFDTEVAGVYPLRYMAQVAFSGANAGPWQDILTSSSRKFVIVGGKGGVGKTSSSSALGVRLADEGYSTVVVSTDPAHSLGDALGLDLKGGKLTPVPGILGGSGGSLYALEVDTEGAVQEFKGVVDGFLRKQKEQAETGSGGNGMLQQLNLEDFADILDSAPPGTDELVALSKVLRLVRGDNELGLKFDRVVIDTAPTGHTLRMLTYPEFLEEFFEKLIKIRNRFKGMSSVMNMFSGGGSKGKKQAAEDAQMQEERDRLRDFQFKMMELQELFRDEEQSEFVVVTIASMLAVAESERLVAQLKQEGVPVKHMIVNKILGEKTQQGYVQRLTKGQAAGLAELEQVASGANVHLTRVPYFDIEVRNVHGLRAMGSILFQKQQ